MWTILSSQYIGDIGLIFGQNQKSATINVQYRVKEPSTKILLLKKTLFPSNLAKLKVIWTLGPPVTTEHELPLHQMMV